jgi:hypothetical protein
MPTPAGAIEGIRFGLQARARHRTDANRQRPQPFRGQLIRGQSANQRQGRFRMDTSTAHPCCCAACRETPIVRSFGPCPECGKIWNGEADGSDRHYRNNAWKICETCAQRGNRCVVCGEAMPR